MKILEIKNLVKNLKKENRKLYNNFLFILQKWEKVLFSSENWTWKTTFFNIIFWIDKKFNWKLNFYTDKIAYVPQEYNLTLLNWYTVYENIYFLWKEKWFSYEEINKKISFLRKKLEINFSFKKLVWKLSWWQKQIVSFIQNIIFEPDILILDEAFSQLDKSKRKKIINLLSNKKYKNLSILISSHREDEFSLIVNKKVSFE